MADGEAERTAVTPAERVEVAPPMRYQVVDGYGDPPRRRLRDAAQLLAKYRWLAATCFGSTVGVTLLVGLFMPRLYTAATRLEIVREPAALQGTAASGSLLATQGAALRSRDLAERVLRSRQLAGSDVLARPGREPAGLVWVGGRMLNLLRPRGWTGASAADAEPEAPHGPEVDPDRLDRYLGYLAVEPLAGTDLIDVRFTTPSPTLSAFLAATHAQAYIEATGEARLARGAGARNALDQQLREAREHAERAEVLLDRFATEHPHVAVNQEQRLTGQRIAELSTLLTRAEGERMALESKHEFLDHAESQPLAYLLDRPGIQKLHLALLDLEGQEAALGSRLGTHHPQIIELGHQQAALERQLAAEIGGEVEAVRARWDAARLREKGLRRKLAQQEQSAAALRELGARYDLLKGDVEGARGLYQALQRQQLDMAFGAQLAAFDVRVVERAEVPKRPSRPNIPADLTWALLAGCVVALGAVVTCEYFDNTVKSRDDVEGLLRLPTLATIPNFALARRAGPHGMVALPGAPSELIVLHEPWSPVAESFRAMRTALLFSTAGAPPKVVMVTSAGASEGKTVSSLNLATTLADSGSEVLLLDLDLRRPRCHAALGVPNEPGLSTFLAGRAALTDVVRPLRSPRLFFVPAGPTPPNPAELVGSVRMLDALAELREAYDFIIVDAPPVLPVTDAIVLGREVDGVLLVVKGHDTPRELVRRARDQLAQSGAHLLGAVVNNVGFSWGDLQLYSRYYGQYLRRRAVGDRRA